MVKTATQPAAHTLAWLQTVPGMGTRLRRVLWSARPDSPRFPRGQDCVASGRVLTGATEAAGQREGTSGTTSGQAALQGAGSAAAVLCLRHPPVGPKSLTR